MAYEELCALIGYVRLSGAFLRLEVSQREGIWMKGVKSRDEVSSTMKNEYKVYNDCTSEK